MSRSELPASKCIAVIPSEDIEGRNLQGYPACKKATSTTAQRISDLITDILTAP